MSAFAEVGEAEGASCTSVRRLRLMPTLVYTQHEALPHSSDIPRIPAPLSVIFRSHQGEAQRNSIVATAHREGRRLTCARESALSSAPGARFMLGGWQAASESRASPSPEPARRRLPGASLPPKARNPLRLLARSGLRSPLPARRRPRPRLARHADHPGRGAAAGSSARTARAQLRGAFEGRRSRIARYRESRRRAGRSTKIRSGPDRGAPTPAHQFARDLAPA